MILIRKLLLPLQGQLQEQEELFNDERNKIREQLHEVTANEQSLLNRIKCLEAEEGQVLATEQTAIFLFLRAVIYFQLYS